MQLASIWFSKGACPFAFLVVNIIKEAKVAGLRGQAVAGLYVTIRLGQARAGYGRLNSAAGGGRKRRWCT